MKQLVIAVIITWAFAGCALQNIVNLSGDWVISSSVGGQIPITVYCTLVQSGRSLSGTCTPEMENPESSALTGSVSASSAQWGYDVVFNGNPGTVSFEADTISTSAMSGTLDLSGTTADVTAVPAD